MEQVPLTAQKRNVLGRKVKTLRREGIIPAHVFGHKITTIHVQVKNSDFSKVFEKVGETGIINLAVDGSKKPVLVRNVQLHPVTSEHLHIDFYQVNLTEKVKVNVPIEIVGEAPAVEKKIGLLLTPVSEVEIEALPADIPEKIALDVSKLENIGDEIKIKDLAVDRNKVTILHDAELVVAQIGELVTKEMEAVEAEIEAEQAEVVAQAAEGEEKVGEAEVAEVPEAEGAEKAEETAGEPEEEVKSEPKK
ncbi:hypothetical protein A3D81_02265 [Candidatus Curtissbacteria bacterium RIFCSPHIGHO2_02_FULL_40_17]|uniref:Large ribosomal subunit protein bL25 n=4 Tax=Candidatus Curtissiibacteriota TaxID=1752717 RepID=A0A1F5GH68_9BACT|nr:MAG: hypothetical protein A2693_00100 [Candidatus Curtissbacteria bacterium RIFCSPHIGHO2_01_FULL_40_12]OGD91195.1 MAG: hypothetical protein A3D81_02265 [Candidatus Curtissbacteria bacterium RIFCSPHIGHO2_02_FULL_40_17]OGE03210.1 MAG: hypothetical protein A3F45_04215 [Candidatus Curtissbacteria bacterium RIFCSPHIGHO2_12_FULL_41_17]OGE06192.1 MAG: hypothetical protein A3I53_00540 [Candidatus Curtissbacteria bacterium RIFCSPLOWO2_02_FULL_40_13b]